jgi:hypothetical protein
MNPKTTIGLVIALLLAVLGIWWIQSPSKPDGPEDLPGPKKLLDVRAGDVTAFEVKTGSASAFSFAKTDGDWTMTAPISGPAEQGTVSGEVGRFAGLEYVKAIPKDDPDRPTDAMTSLADPLKIVKLTDAGGKSNVLKIGKQQTLSKRRYVQKEGDETIFLVAIDLSAELRRGLADYRSKIVSNFKSNEAVRVEVQGDVSYTLVKEGARWTVETPFKARADATAVNKLLGGMERLRAEGFVEGEPANLRPFGLESPRLVVTVTTERRTPRPVEGPPAPQPAPPQYDVETKVSSVAFGGTAEDKVFAKLAAADSRGVFQVPESVLANIRLPLDELRDKRIATLQPNRARQIKIVVGSDAVELSKRGDDWTIVAGADDAAPKVAEFAAVDDLLKAVGNMKAIGFEEGQSPSFGFDAPRASVEITAEGRLEPVKLLLGGLTPSKTGAYLRNEGEGFTAVVKVADAEALAAGPIAYLGRDLLTFTSSRASRIEIVRDGKTSTTERTDGLWRLTAPVDGETEGATVKSILSDLSNLRGRRVVARADDAAQFGLTGPSAIKVTITVEPPPAPATQPASGPADTPPLAAPTAHTVIAARHAGKAYAMRSGGATICEVDGKVLDDLEAELLVARVLSIEPSQVDRLAFSGASSFAFAKANDEWTLSGEASFKTDAAKIDAVLNALRDLRATRYAAYRDADLSRFGLDAANVFVIEVSTGQARRMTLRLSATGPGGGDRYACLASNTGRVFVIKSEDAAKIEKKVIDFQKAGA